MILDFIHPTVLYQVFVCCPDWYAICIFELFGDSSILWLFGSLPLGRASAMFRYQSSKVSGVKVITGLFHLIVQSHTLKLIHKIRVFIKWVLGPIIRLSFSPLNDDVGFIIESLLDCRSVVSEPGFDICCL